MVADDPAVIGISVGVDVVDPIKTGQIIQSMYADVIKESQSEYEQLDEVAQKAVGKRSGGRTKMLLNIWLAKRAKFEEA